MQSQDPTAELAVALTIFVHAIVHQPEEARITVTTTESRTIFTVTSASRDQGKLIGLGGRTVRAFRIILLAASRKYGREFVLDLQRDSSHIPGFLADVGALSTTDHTDGAIVA